MISKINLRQMKLVTPLIEQKFREKSVGVFC